MEALEDGPNGDVWKKNRIKIHGWFDPSVTIGTSKYSNIPMVYNIVPNSPQLSQAILIFERQTDSNQTDHMDWASRSPISTVSTTATPPPRAGSATSCSSTTTSMDTTRGLFGGVDSIGKGYYKNGHDDLQVSSFLWEHKFTDRLPNITEMYYIWQRNARLGGTVIEGNPQAFSPSVGTGPIIHGLSGSLGFVNYTAYKLGDKDRLVLRTDILDDFQGQRLGYKTTYSSTLGVAHYFYDWLVFRPEVRLDYTSGAKALDNGTKREMFSFSADLIIRFRSGRRGLPSRNSAPSSVAADKVVQLSDDDDGALEIM